MAYSEKIAVIGGDRRQNVAADRLTELGYRVATWGLTGETKAFAAAVPEEVIRDADAVLLPLPLTGDGRHVSGTDLTMTELETLMAQKTRLFAGKIPEETFRLWSERYASVTDICREESFMIKNALPTAEGAVELAMHYLPRTLFGSRALVTGYGRIGKVLADMLTALGVLVTVTARKASDMAWASVKGYRVLPVRTQGNVSELCWDGSRFDVIFNTVPSLLITEPLLSALSPDTLLIELASQPGGICREAADRLGFRTVVAPGLPGKVAPVTAGEIIGDLIHEHLKSL